MLLTVHPKLPMRDKLITRNFMLSNWGLNNWEEIMTTT